jgi:hypothetical protein
VCDVNPTGASSASRCEGAPRGPALPCCWSSHSRRAERDVQKVRAGFAVLKTLGNHAQRQCLDASLGFTLCRAVRQNSWEIRHFGDPATVVFSLEYNPEGQAATCFPPIPLLGWRAGEPLRPPNTGDEPRSGARVHAVSRRGHSAAPPAERRLRREGWCRRKLRQLHPPVRRRPVAPCVAFFLPSFDIAHSGERVIDLMNSARRNRNADQSSSIAT